MTDLSSCQGKALFAVIATVVLGCIAAAQPVAIPARDNPDQWCFAWVPPLPAGAQERGVLLKAAKWQPGETITIAFLDGDAVTQKKVMDHARKWTRAAGGPANLNFEFRKSDPNEANIRISFANPGSWSVLGSLCRRIPPGQATMNYGWLKPDTADEEYQRVVLHEFGHALGLAHEHQNPVNGIDWDYNAVIRDLSGPPNKWSLVDISRNMFEPIEAKESNFTAFDKDSIMLYPIPEHWTRNDFSVGLNTSLSATDKKFIAEQYPN